MYIIWNLGIWRLAVQRRRKEREGECKGALSATCSFPCLRPLELCTKWNAGNIRACFLTPSIEKPNQFKRGHYSVEQVWSWNFILPGS